MKLGDKTKEYVLLALAALLHHVVAFATGKLNPGSNKGKLCHGDLLCVWELNKSIFGIIDSQGPYIQVVKSCTEEGQGK